MNVIRILAEQNGEIDWNTLGNILTAAIVGEVCCANNAHFTSYFST